MMTIKINGAGYSKTYKVDENEEDILRTLASIDMGKEKFLCLHECKTGNKIIIQATCCSSIEFKSESEEKEQDESNYIKDIVAINNRLNDFSERIENIEKQMQEKEEEELKKLEAELNYAKLCRTLPIITNETNEKPYTYNGFLLR